MRPTYSAAESVVAQVSASHEEVDPEWDEVRVRLNQDGRVVDERVVPVQRAVSLRAGETATLGSVDFGPLQPGKYGVTADIAVIKGSSKGSGERHALPGTEFVVEQHRAP